jgi:hypothetical protein
LVGITTTTDLGLNRHSVTAASEKQIRVCLAHGQSPVSIEKRLQLLALRFTKRVLPLAVQQLAQSRLLLGRQRGAAYLPERAVAQQRQAGQIAGLIIGEVFQR